MSIQMNGNGIEKEARHNVKNIDATNDDELIKFNFMVCIF